MLNTLKKDDFTSLAQDSLSINHQGRRLLFSVIESHDLPPISPRQSPFSIVLEGPSAPLLSQGIYALNHPQHGQLDLFIVPISGGTSRARYEVIFN